jgi:hypothetical protein
MTGRLCGLGCELPAGHAGDHDDLDGLTWPQGQAVCDCGLTVVSTAAGWAHLISRDEP